MIATQRTIGFNALTKTPGGKAIGDFLYKKMAQAIVSEFHSNTHTAVLSSGVIFKMLSKPIDGQNYEELYNKLFSEIDGAELSEMINSFVELIPNLKDRSDVRLLKIYIFVFFTDFWCQLVEYARKPNDQNLHFIGTKKSSEYSVLKKIFELKNANGSPIKIEHEYATYTFFENTLSRIITKLRRARELNLTRILNNFSRSISLENTSLADKIVVIGILEERRLSRIVELHRELTSLGYKVVLFSCLHKSELIKGLNNYPLLKDCVVYDNYLIDRSEVKDLMNEKKSKIEKILIHVYENILLENCTYNNVPLLNYTQDDLRTVIVHRYLESAIDKEVIKRYLNQVNVCCFIGMDNSVATSVWIEECRTRGIPSLFHFYNAVKSPIVYQTLLESIHPTAWLLGGQSQLSEFSRIKQAEHHQFFLTGDIFADTVVNCDRQQIRKTIREQCSAEEHDIVVVLVSSYIVSEFSIDAKRELFQSVFASTSSLGYKIIIKAHPNENIDVLREEMSMWGIDAFIFHHENIRDVFIASDLACMYFSEAAQQAMLIDVPVISLVPSEMKESFDKHWNYYSSGAVEFIPLGDDPSETISKVVSDADFRKALIDRAKRYTEELLGQSDGNNAERMAEVVHSFILNH